MHAFDVLGDPVRRRILELLIQGEHASGEVVEVISREFGITQSAVSQQLKILRDNGFATVRAEGTRRLYAADTRPLAEVDSWLEQFRRFWGPPLEALATEVARGKRARKTPVLEPSEGSHMSTNTTLKQVMGELAALDEPKMREANERRGDDHGVNLTELRAVAKRLKTQHELALQLWATGDTAARLLATLVSKPKVLSAAELDAMVRDIRSPKLLDWFIVNLVKPSRHAEELRLRWKDEADLVGRAGWSLTTERVVKNAEGLDLGALLDQIEKEMKRAPEQKQWAMNHCLAEIGIHHRKHRARAIGIGERLAVLIDYPASPGCTPPYAPLWIAEMVRRSETAAASKKRSKAKKSA